MVDYLAAYNKSYLECKEGAQVEEGIVVGQVYDKNGDPDSCIGVDIDLARQVVRVNCKLVMLNGREWRLLTALAGQPCRILDKDELVFAVWGSRKKQYAHLAALMQRLRKKLRDVCKTRRMIQTVYGFGYRLVPIDGASDDIVHLARGLRVNLTLSVVRSISGVINLSAVEWLILSCLAKQPNQWVNHSDLRFACSGIASDTSLTSIISDLRGKLGDDKRNRVILASNGSYMLLSLHEAAIMCS